MKKEAIDYVYEQFVEAIEYSNSVSEEIGEEGFDVALAQDGFVEDLMTMSMFALSADHAVTQAEIDKANSWLGEYGFEFDIESCQHVLSLIKDGLEFEVPHVLAVLTCRSKVEVLFAEMGKSSEEVLDAELEVLNTVMCIFADIMCSSVSGDKLLPKEKEVIEKCMQKCNDYISRELSVDFDAYTNYKKVIERYC